uniref:(northern house mosquito) hypothetical protein n=1 Tax=Culex pipiens TaxID=7175 RepID=A0A8D8CNJ9_CULPI
MSSKVRLQLSIRRPANGRQFRHRPGNDRGTPSSLHPDDALFPDVTRVRTHPGGSPRCRGHVRPARSLAAGHAQLVQTRHREADGCDWCRELHPARASAAQVVVSRQQNIPVWRLSRIRQQALQDRSCHVASLVC